MSGEVKAKAISAVLWSGFEQFSTQGVRFVLGVILARLLSPAEFGLLGMLALFLGISQVFINCGFGQALIQRQATTRLDESSVFYANLTLGLLAALGFWFGAPWIAQFYGEPLLVPMTRIMAVDVLVNAMGMIQTMLLTKRIDFRTQMKASFTATVISGLVAVVLAVKGFGALSLAYQCLVGDAIRTGLLWWLHPWRPLARASLASLRAMFPYGSRLFASGLLNTIFDNIHSIVLGKLYSSAALGLYTRAKGMQQLPVNNLSGIVSRVSFPVFASVQHDKATLKRSVRKTLMTLAMLNFPVMMGLAVTAHPLVVVLLTEKWVPCVPLIQGLCVAGALYPLHVVHLNALSAQGRSDLFLRLEIIKKCLLAGAILAAVRYGAMGLVVAEGCVSAISYFLNSHYSSRLFGYSLREQFQDMAPYALATLVMALAVSAVKWLPVEPLSLSLALQVCCGAGVYMACCGLGRFSAFVEAYAMGLNWMRQAFQLVFRARGVGA